MLSVAPLGLIGVVAALLVADKPLGFVALLGVLALVGMIARNSVILIDQIEHERAHGREAWEAVIEATMHRFRPILLTAAAAILGMIPIAPTIFWGPMAYAIMGGWRSQLFSHWSSCRRSTWRGSASGCRGPLQGPSRPRVDRQTPAFAREESSDRRHHEGAGDPVTNKGHPRRRGAPDAAAVGSEYAPPAAGQRA